MNYRKFDEYAYNNKAFSIYCAKKLRRTLNLKYSRDIALIVGLTFAAAFWQFEGFYLWAEPVKIFASLFTCLMWIYISFIYGFKRRDSFIFFILGYWFVPQAFIIWFSSTPVTEYDRYLDLISNISNILVRSPVMAVENITEINWHITVVVLVVICEVFFALGYNIRYSLRKSEWYREFRSRSKNNKYI
ncbi:MAG: hypothetical protein LBR74_06370 [Eubacterium sp.]|nr:hypothetical protein [Eubacterium sp.]